MQLYATNCEIYGPTIVMERLYKNLGTLAKRERPGGVERGVAQGRPLHAADQLRVPGPIGRQRWLLEAGDNTLTGKVETTGSLDRYQEIRAGEIELAAGKQQIVFRSAGPINGELLNLGGVLLKPAPRGAMSGSVVRDFVNAGRLVGTGNLRTIDELLLHRARGVALLR